jgi:hypothetical protein
MCEFCNPLGLAQPAATQAHGTIFLAIGVVVVVMALVGRLVLTGIGPFTASVTGVQGTATGLTITISITNGGNRAGASTCKVDDPASATSESAFFLSPEVQPGATVAFTRQTDVLGQGARRLEVTCGAP